MKDIAESIPPARKRLMSMKLSTAVTLMISSVIGSVLLLVYALWFIQISDTTRDGVKDTALAVARTFADMPEVKQALTLLAEKGAMPIAGGTDVLVQARMLSGEVPLVNIAGLAELKEIFDVEGGISIGSGVCFTDLVKHPLI